MPFRNETASTDSPLWVRYLSSLYTSAQHEKADLFCMVTSMLTVDLFTLAICRMLAFVMPLILHLPVQTSPNYCHSCHSPICVCAPLSTSCCWDHGTQCSGPCISNPFYCLKPLSCSSHLNSTVPPCRRSRTSAFYPKGLSALAEAILFRWCSPLP